MVPTSPLAPSPHEIAASLRPDAEGAVLLVGAGQLSPHPGHPRVSVLRLHDVREPVLLWDGFLPEGEIPALREALASFATVWPGALDTMAATPWQHAWTLPPAPMRVYDHRGRCAGVEGKYAVIGDGVRERRPLGAAEVAAVRGWVSHGGAERGVELVLRAGGVVPVAHGKESSAVIDPTYDEMDLELDAAWIPALGEVLAAALGVPYEAAHPAVRGRGGASGNL